MILYSLEILPRATKGFKKLSHPDQIRVLAALELLRSNPIPPKSIKLKGRAGFRIRVGKCRIIYEVVGDRLLILVLDIAPRREIYRAN